MHQYPIVLVSPAALVSPLRRLMAHNMIFPQELATELVGLVHALMERLYPDRKVTVLDAASSSINSIEHPSRVSLCIVEQCQLLTEETAHL